MSDNLTSEAPNTEPASPETPEKDEKKTQAAMLVDLASMAQLFKDPKGKTYVSVPVRDHRETYPVDSSHFREWLVSVFYTKHKTPPNDNALQSAVSMLSAKARFDVDTQEVNLRVGGDADKVLIDLADDRWQTLQIDATGVQVAPSGRAKFRRPNGMLPLPLPASSGSVAELRPFVNLKDDEQFVLLVGFLIGALNPKGPYPILEITGEQGSAKSTLSKVIRELIDPNVAPARAATANERDLMIAATNGWLLNFDNLSRLTPEMSDALCRLSTGAAFSVRKLYENDEEMLFEAARPIVLNGIEDLANRPDLLERSIVLELPVVPAGKRRDEQEFWADFQEAKPRILAGLYAAVGCAVANRGTLAAHPWPRMADFAKWVTAAEPALGWESGRFLAAYKANRGDATMRVFEKSGIAEFIIFLAKSGWKGTATELLQALKDNDTEGTPKAPNQLSGELKRLAPALRLMGVSVEFKREGPDGAKRIVIGEVTPSIVRTDSIDGIPDVAA